ncbi:hypothetical protein [Halalkalibacter krulwichiae]|uniref:Uncharacterized protein n=1 Tax=Halalkalibacter krulwichiae TaxID=199441 RepID=A0A1X9MEM4_9BACI|nr:hypothetical protein [Halalkalibacter krulwichiae]ARK31866.1 hypothetical protein BkAM31D_19615 [Halalkalibacter krulwichiae]
MNFLPIDFKNREFIEGIDRAYVLVEGGTLGEYEKYTGIILRDKRHAVFFVPNQTGTRTLFFAKVSPAEKADHYYCSHCMVDLGSTHLEPNDVGVWNVMNKLRDISLFDFLTDESRSDAFIEYDIIDLLVE